MDSQALNERNRLVKSRIKGDKARKSYILETITPYICPDNSDRDYIGYVVYPDSRLLSEQGTPFNKKQAVQIGLDLIRTVKEMGRISSGIHHRNIQPGCVIITPIDDTFMASLVNMQTAKVTDYEYTVFASIKGILKRNIYMPRELRSFKEGDHFRSPDRTAGPYFRCKHDCRAGGKILHSADRSDVRRSKRGNGQAHGRTL